MRQPVKDEQDDDNDNDELPPCWGKLWDPREPDCQKCEVFSSCGREVGGAKVEVPTPPFEAPRSAWSQLAPRLGANPPVQESLLSVPEVRRPGESPYSLLGREITRTVAKSFFGTITNFFDRTPLSDLFKKRK